MKRAFRTPVVIGSLVASSALLLTACSSGSTPEATTADGGTALSGDVSFYDTSGGDVWTALDETLFADFTAETGVTVSDDYNEASTKFMAAAEAGEVPWSLVFLPSVSDAAYAAEQGYLAPIDTDIVPVDDLVDGTYDETGVQVGTFGMVLAWNDESYPDKAPSTMSDLFDTTDFPGKRCFFNNPQYGWTLEAALLADGVAPDALYPLDTERAFAKLDTIKDDIVWWSSGAQSIESFENGSCDIGIVWANRAFTAKTANDFPISVSWDGAGYANSVWAIPAGAPNPEAAQQLLANVIANTEGQLAFATRVPTPIPAQVKALGVTDFPESAQQFLPVGDNVTDSIALDNDYYTENNDALSAEFAAWIAQ